MKTEIVFVLDRSGSMSGLESDTIGGFNSLLEKQKAEKGEAVVTTVLFDHEYELLHDHINIRNVCPITSKEYYTRGNTALLDAMGRTINKIINIQRNTLPEKRADKVIFIVITDGMENSSHEFTAEQIKKKVETEEKEYGWEFIFLGANMDAIAAAGRIGIQPQRASNYCSDSQGTRLNYEVLCEAISEVRVKKTLSPDWHKRIDEDAAKRSH